ncbi:hypothetical protein PanWU01x14_055130, partial [Parasponia andersonii]
AFLSFIYFFKELISFLSLTLVFCYKLNSFRWFYCFFFLFFFFCSYHFIKNNFITNIPPPASEKCLAFSLIQAPSFSSAFSISLLPRRRPGRWSCVSLRFDMRYHF